MLYVQPNCHAQELQNSRGTCRSAPRPGDLWINVVLSSMNYTFNLNKSLFLRYLLQAFSKTFSLRSFSFSQLNHWKWLRHPFLGKDWNRPIERMRAVPVSCLAVQLVPYHRQPLCSPLKPSLSSPVRKETKIKDAMTLGQGSLPWIENKWHLAQGRMPQGSRTRWASGSKDNHFHLLISSEGVCIEIYLQQG